MKEKEKKTNDRKERRKIPYDIYAMDIENEYLLCVLPENIEITEAINSSIYLDIQQCRKNSFYDKD
jgi:hypothetical protein